MVQARPLPRLYLDDTTTRVELIATVVAQTDWPQTLEACWEWTGTRQQVTGHGRIAKSMAGITFQWPVHRLTFAWWYDFDPGESVIDHLCGNPPCINPLHLQATTHQINTLRGESPPARNAQKTHCSKGHPFYGDNLYVEPSGRRRCRACVAARGKAWKEKVNYGHYGKGKRGKRRQGANRTECVRGHPATPENTYYRASGAVECRVCHRERN